jgi:hypothetical protein
MLKKSGSPVLGPEKNSKTQCAPLLFFFQPNKLFNAGFSRCAGEILAFGKKTGKRNL